MMIFSGTLSQGLQLKLMSQGILGLPWAGQLQIAHTATDPHEELAVPEDTIPMTGEAVPKILQPAFRLSFHCIPPK